MTDASSAPTPEPCWAVVFVRNGEIVVRAVSSERADVNAIAQTLHPSLNPKLIRCDHTVGATLRDIVLEALDGHLARARAQAE